MTVLYKKVFRELALYKGRTILAFAGIFIGLYCIGFTLSAYTIMQRELHSNYMDTRPASIRVQVADLDADALALIRQFAGTADVEARKRVQARIRANIREGEATYGSIHLYAVEDMREIKSDAFSLEQGTLSANSEEMLLERDSQNILPPLSGNVYITVPGGEESAMRVSGLAHAPGLPPASMEKFSYGFMSLEALQRLGSPGWFNEALVRVHENGNDRDALIRLGEKLRVELVAKDYTVEQVVVPVPNKHPHGDQLASLLFLLQVFAVIALFSAAAIIVNLLNSIMSTQIRQIAVMKATGAHLKDVALPYFLYVFIISVCAIVISLPLAKLTGNAYAAFAARILNFNINDYGVPIWVYATHISLGLIIPLGISLYPVYRTCRVTVKEGLFGAAMPESGSTFINAIHALSTKAKIPFNNLLRNKSRMLMAVVSLAVGGCIFMTAQNIVASIESTVTASMNKYTYSHDIELYGAYPESQIQSALSGVNVNEFEIYHSKRVQFVKPDGTHTPLYLLKILPDNSGILSFEDADAVDNCILISQGLHDDEKWIGIGKPVSLNSDGVSASLRVGGVVGEVPPLPFAYMRRSVYEKMIGTDTGAQHVILYGQGDIRAIMEKSFAEAGISIADNSDIKTLREAFVDHLTVIVNFLSVTALLAVFVGGLAIASAIGISIAERRREIGTMRAIGADSPAIIRLVMVEVAIMGCISWILAVLLSYPVAKFAGNEFGRIFLHSDLVTTVSVTGAAFWLLLSLATALVSAFLPAMRAAKAPLKKTL